MKICENIHQIRIEFYVTPEIKRFVYVYLIVGKYCYLIDAGVAGCETVIADYMKGLGRDISEIKAIFLTHAHPDHIGGAAVIKRLSGCDIYASAKEKVWIENIDEQFVDRPIPNFYTLVHESVKVDYIVNDADEWELEQDITIQVMNTPGHSKGSVSYVYIEKSTIFCGDVIPVVNDFPIFVDYKKSESSIMKIRDTAHVDYCCPAWDRVYYQNEIMEKAEEGLLFIQKLNACVKQMELDKQQMSQDDLQQLGACIGLRNVSGNPLFRKSVEACIEVDIDKS